MLEALDHPCDNATVLSYFYDCMTLSHYLTWLPLLDKEE
jgi:hypothetical protein